MRRNDEADDLEKVWHSFLLSSHRQSCALSLHLQV
jgi:hypothetical protein